MLAREGAINGAWSEIFWLMIRVTPTRGLKAVSIYSYSMLAPDFL